MKEEVTFFYLPTGTRTWLQPKQDVTYEMHYLPDQPVGQASPSAKGWVFPALFRTGDTWVLLTEANLGRTYCGSVLRATAPAGDYRIGFPGVEEAFPGGEALPHSTPAWHIAALGSLKTIAKSTVGTDLAHPKNRRLTHADREREFTRLLDIVGCSSRRSSMLPDWLHQFIAY